jgi:thiol:disulfide interchange protein
MVLAWFLTWAAMGSAGAAHTRASLLLAAETVKPGDTVLVGLRLRMDPRWHTYWKNPGALGLPTKLTWNLPAGINAEALQWPAPEKLPDGDLTTYIYTNEVVLLTTLRVASNLPPGPVTLRADVSWLECLVECVPGKASLEATLNVGPETKPSADAALLKTWSGRIPQPGRRLSATARWDGQANGKMRTLILEWNSENIGSAADFFPDATEDYEVQPQTERISSAAEKVALRKTVKKFSGDWPQRVSGLAIQQSGAQRLAWEVAVPITGQVSTPALATHSLGTILLFAFLGGLILNVMPCVLPVIALKVLGFVNQAREEPRRVRHLGLMYGLGVMVSFAALAGIVIGLQAAGKQAGWGFQFSSPGFLIVMTVVVTLIALNLFGLFEVSLGGGASGAASSLSSRHGMAGAFFSGLLATVLATSCSAPFLGIAVGFASAAQKPGLILLILLTVGLGLAAPQVVLSWHPAWLRLVPKPGRWMERFKVLMGFPMLGAGVWLCSLVSIHYGEQAWWLAVFLVFLAVAAWTFGEFVQRGTRHRWVGRGVVLGLLAFGYFYAIQGRLTGQGSESMGNASIDAPKSIDWQPWSPEAIAKARAEGHPVVVDFTAKWCLTCNTVVKPAFESASVRQKLTAVNAVPFLADYTLQPPEITAELIRLGRAAVPLVVVYPRDPAKPPILFDLVTAGTLVGALEQAAQ